MLIKNALLKSQFTVFINSKLLKFFFKKSAKCIKTIFFAVLILPGTSSNLASQDFSYEIWPEIDVWYKITPGLRLSSFASTTRYLESNTRDFNITLQADHSFGKSKKFLFTRLLDQNQAETLKVWLVRGGYMGGWSLYDQGESYSEDMLFAEIHRRILMRRLILFSQRLRMDNRFLGQDNPDYSYRIRYRAMFEKEFLSGKTSIIPFISAEPFYDSRYNTVNRVRAIGGTTVTWKQRFALEGNITYQYDSKPNTKNLLAFNAILHLYIESKKVKVSENEK
jgi:hypothetical protein